MLYFRYLSTCMINIDELIIIEHYIKYQQNDKKTSLSMTQLANQGYRPILI